MIKLAIAEYCHDCPSFNSITETVFNENIKPERNKHHRI